MSTKEEFEIEKIKLEIAQLNEPFWKKPNIMISVTTVLLTAIIGFSSYFAKVDQEHIAQIKALESKIKENKEASQKLELENLNIKNTHIQIQAEQYQKNYDESKIKLSAMEKDIAIKSKNLANFITDLKKTKSSYNLYKEKVNNITQYMANYGVGYAKGVLSSNSGKLKINQIATLPTPDERVQEIERFTTNIINQTFAKYTTKKAGELALLDQPGQ